MQLKAITIITLKLLRGKRIKLIVDSSLMPVASPNTARTRGIGGIGDVIMLLTYLYAYAVGYSFYRAIKDSASYKIKTCLGC
jgi:hypothetical protein